ncbi:hypothetical protein [Calycomorphotria hydatis]|uniref:Uncharacterized protein n=1 Tax=Calycomorphotria hydatis TaxID=2528027 RepID=A0A517TFB7_9PLAN|nr:hypothetical protein [Calycomorphotria hydatis]QDT67069.1 hypothetical protein V22_43410 [Calycomorphotria hydatis]
MFSESFTVRILADSSSLRSELESVTRQIESLGDRLTHITSAERAFGRISSNVSNISTAARPAAAALDGILQRIQRISGTPLQLNVQPALSSLAVLSRGMDLIYAKLRTLSAGQFALGGLSLPSPVPTRRFATGGYVNGPGGVDRVPAMLTAGEYVLRRPVVQQLGVELLNEINRGSVLNQRSIGASSQASTTTSQVTNFGDIAINVKQGADIAGVVRDLRLEGARLRTRRG